MPSSGNNSTTIDYSTTNNAIQVTWSPTVAMVMAALAGFGIFGNILIVAAVCLQKRLRVLGNVFVVNLAIVDFVITAYVMPIGIATSQFKIVPLSEIICDVSAFLVTATCGVSTQSLALIAVERYCHICQTKHYRKFFTKGLVATYVVFIWIYAIVWACQGWTGWTIFVYGQDTYICTFHGPYSLSYDICLAVFGMILPMVILVFCYVKIFLAVNKSNKRMQDHRQISSLNRPPEHKFAREYKLICMLFTIVLVFVIFWIPAAIVLILSSAVDIPVVFYTITIWIALCNSSINSIIYGCMNKNFRRGYAQFLRHICCCCFKQSHECCQKLCHCLPKLSRSSLSTSQSRVGSNEPSTSTAVSGSNKIELTTVAAIQFSHVTSQTANQEDRRNNDEGKNGTAKHYGHDSSYNAEISSDAMTIQSEESGVTSQPVKGSPGKILKNHTLDSVKGLQFHNERSDVVFEAQL